MPIQKTERGLRGEMSINGKEFRYMEITEEEAQEYNRINPRLLFFWGIKWKILEEPPPEEEITSIRFYTSDYIATKVSKPEANQQGNWYLAHGNQWYRLNYSRKF